MMLNVTVDQVLSWGPCGEYTRERIEELFAGRETVNVHDILAMDIPAANKLWTVLRKELIPADILHELACRVAEQALLRAREAGREPDKRSWQAVEVKHKWLQGKATDTDLAAARAAAEAVARAAAAEASAWAEARAAAEAAAWAAARAAAEEAAWAAADVAAWVAAEEAAWVAAEEAARAAAEAARAAKAEAEAKHIELLKKLLKKASVEDAKCNGRSSFVMGTL